MKGTSREHDYMIKLLLIGDGAVGKTSLLLRFAEDFFQKSHLATIGIDFKMKNTVIDGKNIKM